MKKLIASLLLALTLTLPAAENLNRYEILPWWVMSLDISQCFDWDMPLTTLLGPEDAYYISPAQEDINAMVAFAIAHKEWTPYVEQAWDCDNFAREAKHWMDVWALRNYRNSRAAVTVGVAYVKLSLVFPDGSTFVMGYHALNVIRRNDGQWFFYEPQNGKLEPIELSLEDGSVEIVKINL